MTDFGLAEDTLRGRIVDERVYLPHAAPELFEGVDSSKRSDVFAAGCTIYRLVTGQEPFPDGDYSVTPKAAHLLNPQVPLAVERAINVALSIDPTDRYKDAVRMQSALAGLRVRASWHEVADPGALTCWECRVPDGALRVRLVKRPRAGYELTAQRDRGSGHRKVSSDRFPSEAQARQAMRVILRGVVQKGSF